MKKYNDAVNRFLQKALLDPDEIDFNQQLTSWLDEMERGLSGDQSSFMMIPTFINGDFHFEKKENVIAIDAGGTTLRSALITAGESGELTISRYKQTPMPGTTGRIDKPDFYDKIAQSISHMINESDQIGLCFSYAIKPLPDGDAQILAISKNLNVKGLEGDRVAEQLRLALRRLGLPSSQKIRVINDGASTLLSGLSQHGSKNGVCAGYILGTGTNTCYIEQASNISKLSDCRAGSMLINIETGGYNKFPQSTVDIAFSKTVATTYENPYERMVSGKYQGGLLLSALKLAAEYDLLTTACSKQLTAGLVMEAADIDDFLSDPQGAGKLARLCANDKDRYSIYSLADALAERAAKLAAINLAGVILKSQCGKDPCSPALIVAEGSTFYKSVLFLDKLKYFILTELNWNLKRYCKFLHVDNSSLVGAGISGMI